MPELTVAAGLARGLMELAVSKGASLEMLAERSQIDPLDLQDHDKRIPFAKYVALMKAGQEMSHDPALALHYGERDLSEYSIVGLIGNACETAAEAFLQLNRYSRLVIEVDGVATGDRFVLSHSDDKVWLVDTRARPNDFPELTESTFARMVCSFRRLVQVPVVHAVHVTHAPPPYRAEYNRIFRAPVVFASDKNALLIDAALSSYKVARAPGYVFGILSKHAEALLKSLEMSRSIRGRVEKELIPILHTGEVRMETVAKKLGLSRQTLFRRLKVEGVTYEKVLDELRHTMARHYLSGQKVSVNETAWLVGFSEPAAFSHAFKRWTGMSPSALQRALGAHEDSTE
jgi:AraC-like DNA-binding protein